MKIDQQGSDNDIEQTVTIWPGTAYQIGVSGHVVLRCLIDIHGLAERCQVIYEAPTGKGFGAAALEMRPTIKLAPAMGADGPIAAHKTISITFKAPERRLSGPDVAEAVKSGDFGLLRFNKQNGIEMRKVTMLDSPVWVAAASFEDLAAAYPRKAGGVEGYAVAHCMVRHTGSLDNCQVIKEEPQGKDFGDAALSLASKFKVSPLVAKTHHADQLWVDVPVRFPTPAELAKRTVMAPTWLTAVDRKSPPKLFPPEAATAGLTTGRGVARCTVGVDGILTACVPEAGDPDGLGFSEAAAKLVTGMKMNLWSADAEPVTGGVVHIPIRLNLREPASQGSSPG